MFVVSIPSLSKGLIVIFIHSVMKYSSLNWFLIDTSFRNHFAENDKNTVYNSISPHLKFKLTQINQVMANNTFQFKLKLESLFQIYILDLVLKHSYSELPFIRWLAWYFVPKSDITSHQYCRQKLWWIFFCYRPRSSRWVHYHLVLSMWAWA